MITALKSRSEADNTRALMDTASIDTASLMARYGTKLAMGAGAASPASPLAPTMRAA